MALRQDEIDERERAVRRYQMPRRARAQVAEADQTPGWVIAVTLLSALAAATVLTALF